MKKFNFEVAEYNPNKNSGEQWLFSFTEYDVSVIKGPYSYGGSQGLYELAVLEKYGSLCYDTPIASDVLGYLSENEVEEILIKCNKLFNY